ncbi:hypothetical protein VTJ04DRAFT_5314 [Mycothermus thermophilus]|uniref:uncharacterized protein n=1 Tax=Humicola insolens TaxID=85995 RepID=UPI0037423E63
MNAAEAATFVPTLPRPVLASPHDFEPSKARINSSRSLIAAAGLIGGLTASGSKSHVAAVQTTMSLDRSYYLDIFTSCI